MDTNKNLQATSHKSSPREKAPQTTSNTTPPAAMSQPAQTATATPMVNPVQGMTLAEKRALLNGPTLTIRWNNYGRRFEIPNVPKAMMTKFSGQTRVCLHEQATSPRKNQPAQNTVDFGKVACEVAGMEALVRQMKNICNSDDLLTVTPKAETFLRTLMGYEAIRILNINLAVSRARAIVMEHITKVPLKLNEFKYIWETFAADEKMVDHMIFSHALFNLKDQLPNETEFEAWADTHSDFLERLGPAIEKAKAYIKKGEELAERQKAWLAKESEREANHKAYLERKARRDEREAKHAAFLKRQAEWRERQARREEQEARHKAFLERQARREAREASHKAFLERQAYREAREASHQAYLDRAARRDEIREEARLGLRTMPRWMESGTTVG